MTIVFDDDVDIYWARQQVTERLQQVQNQIPQDVGTPALGPISTGLGEIYQYVIRPKKGYEKKYDINRTQNASGLDCQKTIAWCKRCCRGQQFWWKTEQYEISVNPDKLNAYGITITDVFDALKTNNHKYRWFLHRKRTNSSIHPKRRISRKSR